MRVVHDHEEVLALVDGLDAPGHAGQGAMPAADDLVVDAQQPRGRQRAQAVANVERPAAPRSNAAIAHAEREAGRVDGDVLARTSASSDRPYVSPATVATRRAGGGRPSSSMPIARGRGVSGVNSRAFAAKYASMSAW